MNLPSTSAAQTQEAWQQLHTAACAPYAQAGRFAWHWARGKLGRDPVFVGMLQRGDLPAQARVVDIGCGQGLLASLLQACSNLQTAGHWPSAWPVAASATAYTGIELMASDVKRAQVALGSHTAFGAVPSFTPQFVCADMCSAPLPACDVVVILDVLHYVDHAAQQGVLAKVRDALAAGLATKASSSTPTPTPTSTPTPARLLLRVGDVANTRGFAISQWVDRVVTTVRGHRVAPTWGRTVVQWVQLLQSLGFVVHTVPQSQGTPFANVLLVADMADSPASQPIA